MPSCFRAHRKVIPASWGKEYSLFLFEVLNHRSQPTQITSLIRSMVATSFWLMDPFLFIPSSPRTSTRFPCFTLNFSSWQEGKDKMFLIEKLTKLQDMEKRVNPSALDLERREVEVRPQLSWGHTPASL
jgi:hypothetical protein